jgi:thiol:disulfide interchange protein/DsbC/DsbD-like thiol-disulfide interchange protein
MFLAWRRKFEGRNFAGKQGSDNAHLARKHPLRPVLFGLRSTHLMSSFRTLLQHLASSLAISGSLLFPAAWAQTGSKAVVSTAQVRAELMAHAPDGADAGKTVWVGLQLTHKPEWHTYWKNSGDSGQATSLAWTLPEGVVAGDIAWPTPKKIPIGTLANYGYENTVLLPVPLTVSPNFKPSLLSGDIEVKLKAAWLVCKKECIPEEGEFALKIPVKSSTALNAAAFDATFKATPQPVAGSVAGAIPDSRALIDGQSILFEVQGLPVSLRGKKLEYFPETPEVIETAASGEQEWRGAVWRVKVPLSAQRSNSPTGMPLVLAAQVDGVRQSYRAELPVSGSWPVVAAAATVSPALEAALKANAAASIAPNNMPSLGLIAALLGALFGGLILNLMPCVFPVLAIKVMGFAQNANDQRSHRASALAYTAGVVLSFVALGALMLLLRSAGEQLGWGFQLQSPAVVATLAVLFTVIGLNLAGLFEFGMLVPSSVASTQVKNPTANAFLSGVLAVAIASPCTAPFMGASLGLAVSLPAHEALLIFGALGLGMALPFALAGFVPAVARALPRPGAWMDTFRRLMAFPMFATVVWLVWVLGQQSGIDGAGALLLLLVAAALVIYAMTLRGRGRLVIAILSINAFAFLLATLGPYILQPVASVSAPAAGERWQAWEPGRVEQLLASGQPVFVDFTAAWCVTCQVNKKTTLTNAQVLADMDAKKVVLLRADWTRRDPAITAALGQLGRNGVPLYVVYKPGAAPVLLSELLSVADVREVLGKL